MEEEKDLKKKKTKKRILNPAAKEVHIYSWICLVLSKQSPDRKEVSRELSRIFGKDIDSFVLLPFSDESEDGAHVYVRCKCYEKHCTHVTKSKMVSSVFPSSSNPYIFSDSEIADFELSINEKKGVVEVNDIVTVIEQSNIYSNLVGVVVAESKANVSVLFKFNTKNETINISRESLQKIGVVGGASFN